MRHSRRRGRRIAIAATVLGTILLLAGTYVMFVENEDDEPRAAGPTAPSVSLQPTQPPRDEVPDGFEKFFDADGSITVTGDPLKNAGTGNTVHDVVITLTSDGPMKYVYRTQYGDSAVLEANRRTSKTYRLRGPRAVAQAYVQVSNGSTFATCTITVDGVRASTNTATKLYQVVVCTG